MTKLQQITRRNRQRRTMKAAGLVPDVAPTPTIDPGASPLARLEQMQKQHQTQRETESLLQSTAASIETREEFDLWLNALLQSKTNTPRVLNWVIYNQNNGRKLAAWLPDYLASHLEAWRLAR